MKLPKKIKIGETEYKIKEIRIFFNKNIAGKISYNNKKMKINFNKSERVIEDVFFHEVAHGILKELEFNNPKISAFRNNEVFVQEMGLILRKIFLDLVEEQKK